MFHRCKKNPRHSDFITIQGFRMEHLPPGYRDDDLLELVKATADLTVRVDVQHTSEHRPEFWPGTYIPYAFHDQKESAMTRVGTGRICHVTQSNEGSNQGDCPCARCRRAGKPNKVYGKIIVATAAHVVFDDDEALETTCRIFYDRQDSDVITVQGCRVLETNVAHDRCQLECVTCDAHLLDRLARRHQEWFNLWRKVHSRYKTSGQPHKLTVIVSHPHGCPKRISVGQWVNRARSGDDKSSESGAADEKSIKYTKYTYTACTCPGSSGAYVYILGCNDVWLYSDHVHSGVDFSGANISSVGWK